MARPLDTVENLALEEGTLFHADAFFTDTMRDVALGALHASYGFIDETNLRVIKGTHVEAAVSYADVFLSMTPRQTIDEQGIQDVIRHLTAKQTTELNTLGKTCALTTMKLHEMPARLQARYRDGVFFRDGALEIIRAEYGSILSYNSEAFTRSVDDRRRELRTQRLQKIGVYIGAVASSCMKRLGVYRKP